MGGSNPAIFFCLIAFRRTPPLGTRWSRATAFERHEAVGIDHGQGCRAKDNGAGEQIWQR
jgi:hypothetical protein